MAAGEKRRTEHQGNQQHKKARKEKGRAARAEIVEESRQRKEARDDAVKPIYVVEFSKEEIENEERRPKKKAAMLFGYAGSGYSGLQLSNTEKTIEGELFKGCALAGAISKANSDDVKKVSWARCARTDKGVHAGGNVVSAKFILEDEDIVERINNKLPPQIRIWGFQRTISSFSAYQMVDSRIYEFLIPTYCFLPPHPRTFLGGQIPKLAKEADDEQGYQERQKDVLDFWPQAEKVMQSALDQYEPEIREKALDIVLDGGLQSFKKSRKDANTDGEMSSEKPSAALEEDPDSNEPKSGELELSDTMAEAVMNLKKAYRDVRLAYRIDDARLARVRSCFSQFVGTHSFHNYTVRKKMGDPSAKRFIKSFAPAENPILIDGSEWLSLKVHGQSFMMHQIRKMVFMAAMVVRCGTDDSRFQDSFNTERMNIPKAPGLGLLLERPIFDKYNSSAAKEQGGYGAIDFEQYDNIMAEFKQREIYDRIYREEEKENLFYYLWSSVDTQHSSQLLYLSSLGMKAVEHGDYGADQALDAEIFGDEEEGIDDQ